MSLDLYTGPWTHSEAAHLLRRCMFGPTFQQIEDAVANGMASTVMALLQTTAIGDPITFDFNEAIAPMGTTWINSIYPSDTNQAASTDIARDLSLTSWLIERINTEGLSIIEKLSLFWQNYFSVPGAPDARASFDYYLLIRNSALGNVKQLVKDVTVDPAMLLFLNGATNSVNNPNENYARELFELFTIGKGKHEGGGDYSNYTEHDIAEAAKILTGFYVEGLRSDSLTSVNTVFDQNLHDSSVKTLSHRFNYQTIGNNGANEYEDLIELIFSKEECAKHICRRLYRFFVNHHITKHVEVNVIWQMAETLIINNYELSPVLSELLSSQHFYDASIRGCVLKSPFEFVFSMFNSTQSVPTFTLNVNSWMRLNLHGYCEVMGQAYTPPSVAGWEAYYQKPSFYKLWMNSELIKQRFQFASLVTVSSGIPLLGQYWKVDALYFLNSLSDPSDPTIVVENAVLNYFPKGLDSNQKLILKLLLTDGQPDVEWTIEYSNYLSDPSNQTNAELIRTRVEAMLDKVYRMPEFHVS